MAQTFGGVTETLEAAQQDVRPHEFFPWPPPPGSSPTEAFFTTWKEACFQPASFFRRMPREDQFGSVLVYYLIIGVVAAGVQLFWHSVLGGFTSHLLSLIGADRLPAGSSNGVVDFLLSPLWLLFTLYLVSGVCHLVLLMMRGARHGFRTTTRVFAFSYSPILFVVVPVLGAFVAMIWMVVIAIAGLREAHETDGAKAAVSVLVPVFLLLSLLVLGAILALTMGLLNTKL